MNDASSYNPTAVISAAHAKLSAGDWEGGQFLFQSSLLEWTDDAREAAADDRSSAIPEQQREAVATLWLAYAQYLVDAKQFKSATQAYADAVASVVAGRVGRVHAAAARYALDRHQRQTAMRIYRQALLVPSSSNNSGNSVVEDEQDRELLWNDFLDMMRLTKPQLTMAELRAAITEQDATTAIPPSKRPKLNEGSTNDVDASMEPGAVEADTRWLEPAVPTKAESKTYVVTIESVQDLHTETWSSFLGRAHNSAATAVLPDETPILDGTSRRLPPDVTAAWMSRDGHGVPLERPLSLFRPSPPKLSDPTSKDVLGVDLAVQLAQRLLSPSGGIVLEVCRAMWMLQAWTEHTCRTQLAAHDASLLAQHERLEGEWDARWSVAGNAATADAVAQMNEQERQRFQWHASEQRQQAISHTVWNMRQLLCWQQQALAKVQVPGFTDEGITSMIDADSLLEQSHICQYLHSAFYIRNRMGSEPHESMLKSQLKKLLREQENNRHGSHSPKSMSHPFSYPPPQPPHYRNHSPVPPPPPGSYTTGMMPPYNLFVPPPHQAGSQQQQQQPMMPPSYGQQPMYHNAPHTQPPPMMQPAPMYPFQPNAPPPNQPAPPYGNPPYPYYQQ